MSVEYTARVAREGKWWVVSVEGVGHTQGRSLAEAQEMAADLVAVVLDVPVDSVSVDMVIELPVKFQREVDEAKTAIVDLTSRQNETARVSRKAVRDLVRDLGLTGRDASLILGVSPQRVSQLLASPVKADSGGVVRPAYAARVKPARAVSKRAQPVKRATSKTAAKKTRATKA